MNTMILTKLMSVMLLAALLASCSGNGIISKSEIKKFTVKNGNDLAELKNVTHFRLLDNTTDLVCTTKDSVMLISNSKPIATFECSDIITLIGDAKYIHIATTHGYYRIDREAKIITQIPLPSKNKFPQVNAFTYDKKDVLWIATEGQGLFSIANDGSVHPEGTYALVSSLACTDDSSLWVGTNIGLIRKYADGRVERYYEETSNGISLPDNIVEHLQVDQSQNLWVFMSSAVSVLTPHDYAGTDASDSHEDPMTYAYLGSEGTHISKFFQHPSHPGLWWALASGGVLRISGIDLTAEQTDSHSAPDKLQAPKGAVEKLTILRDEKGSSVSLSTTNDMNFDTYGNLWAATPDGIYVIGSSVLRKPSQNRISGK